jgi:hypothetical protein
MFILFEFPSPLRRIFIGSHSLPPSLVRRIGLSEPTLELGQAGRLEPTGPGPSRPGSVAPSLLWALMDFCTLPLHLHYFDDVILASKVEVLLA